VELSWLLIFKIIAFLIIFLIGIGLFSELSWLIKLKLTAGLSVGIILIGLFIWPLVKPAEPFGVVSLLAGSVSVGDAGALIVLAFLAGFLAYFLAWPYGREIGILAAPAGLAIWAVRSGGMAGLVQQLNSNDVAQRQALFAAVRWEPIFWLAVVAAGFGGVLLGSKICPGSKPEKAKKVANSKSNMHLNIVIALVGSLLIAKFCIRVFAQDVGIFDSRLGLIMAQPSTGQIVFAVSVSFGIAAFIVKKFLNVSYIWPIIVSAFVTAFVVTTYVKQDTLQLLCQRWPGIFFSNTVVSILPIQMVAFGTLGSIAGYWIAVSYNYWRKHG